MSFELAEWERMEVHVVRLEERKLLAIAYLGKR